MPDPRRSEPARPAHDADRDSRVEQLLVDGLDRYFAGRFEDAIHLWTRVLFLDRAHDRARAYIDRARTAIAERQRRADEWLHDSERLLAEGQVAGARDLLDRAVAAAGEDDVASSLRVRLDRLERAHAARAAASPMATSVSSPLPAWRWPRRATTGTRAAMAAAALGGLVLVAVVSVAVSRMGLGNDAGPEALSVGAAPVRLPVLTASDVALVRARTLFTRGRLAEALQALDRVGPESPERDAADRLRIQIQQLLLATSRVRTPVNGQGDSR